MGENPEKNQHICSGVFIKNGYVLTAARCVDRNKNIAKNWMVKSLSYIRVLALSYFWDLEKIRISQKSH